MALVIQVDGTTTAIKGEGEGGALTLEQLKAAIGGWLEMLRCDPDACQGFDHVYFDEEGKLKGLPINRVASEMLGRLDFDPLVGPVVFCRTGGEDGGDSF
jgi:hypothetical protein